MLDTLQYAVRQADLQGARDAEAYGISSSESEVFIENNDLKQAKSQASSVLGVRVILDGGSMGFYSVNSLDKEKVSDAVGKACKVASICPKDRCNSLPSSRPKIRILSGIWDRASKSFSPTDTAALALELLNTAKRFDSRISVDSGHFSAAFVTHGIANSNGLQIKERISTFFWSLMGMAIDGPDVSNFDVQTGGTHHVKKIDVVKTATEFARTVIVSLGARKIDSFKGEMLLTPEATGDMVGEPIAHSINSDSVQRKSSHFAGRLEKKVASELLSVYDDGTDTEGLSAASFDREGVPHRRVSVIEKGILQKFLYNTYTAKKDGVPSTGNAGGSANSVPFVSATNLVLGPGKSNFDSLLSEIDNGILIRRFSGNVNPVNGDYSGVVKGGHLIRNGSAEFPVKEVMVAGNIFGALKNLTGVSKERKVIFDSVLPYCRFGEVSFTAG